MTELIVGPSWLPPRVVKQKEEEQEEGLKIKKGSADVLIRI